MIDKYLGKFIVLLLSTSNVSDMKFSYNRTIYDPITKRGIPNPFIYTIELFSHLDDVIRYNFTRSSP